MLMNLICASQSGDLDIDEQPQVTCKFVLVGNDQAQVYSFVAATKGIKNG